MLPRLFRWLMSVVADEAKEVPNGDKLIIHMEVYVEARCPCGSQHIHRLSLTATSECARCGRTLGVRSLEYFRPHVNALPDPVVSVGYVLTADSLARRPTSRTTH
jgi:hypothetical protein